MRTWRPYGLSLSIALIDCEQAVICDESASIKAMLCTAAAAAAASGNETSSPHLLLTSVVCQTNDDHVSLRSDDDFHFVCQSRLALDHPQHRPPPVPADDDDASQR